MIQTLEGAPQRLKRIGRQIGGKLEDARRETGYMVEDGVDAVFQLLKAPRPSLIERFLDGRRAEETYLFTWDNPAHTNTDAVSRAEFVETVIGPWENKYGMTSKQFIREYRRGKLGDNPHAGDFGMWASHYKQMERTVRQDAMQS